MSYFTAENIGVKIQASQLLEESAFIGAAALLDDVFYESIKVELKYM